jgi:DNA adenine methylase
MRYLGGKVRLAKEIAAKIVEYIPFGGTYVEPFCGGCAVAIKVREYRPDVAIICNDLHPYLIALLRGVADGSFEPPLSLSEEEYKYIKAHKDEDPALTGFAGFGCSFLGQWFHGFSKYKEGYRNSYGNKYRPATLEAHDALTRDRPALSTMEFYCGDYTALAIPAGAVVYCDPPYKGVTGYPGITPFDYSAFVTWIKALALSHDAFMSEYAENVDAGANVVWRKTYAGSARTGDRKKRPVRTDVLVKV